MGDTRLSPIALALQQAALDGQAVQADNPAVGSDAAGPEEPVAQAAAPDSS
jgi:hypothetical protein